MVALLLSSFVLLVEQQSTSASNVNPTPLFIMGIALITIANLYRAKK
jgi:hypothetical protein